MALPHSGAELLGEHIVIGESIRDDGAAHALAFEVDLGDQVDLALLGDAKTGFAPLELNGAGAENDFYSCGEKDGIWQECGITLAGVGVASPFAVPCRPRARAAARARP